MDRIDNKQKGCELFKLWATCLCNFPHALVVLDNKIRSMEINILKYEQKKEEKKCAAPMKRNVPHYVRRKHRFDDGLTKIKKVLALPLYTKETNE